MLFLGVTPTLPNTFINFASPIVDVPYHVFFLATSIGLIPAAYITVQGIFLCSDVVLSVLLLLVHSLCPNSRITLLFFEPQAGIALSDLRYLNDLCGPQSIALLFFIGM
jgi:uncharacterized membrane protein YdjX (TVP38/TMEM64 family)